MAKVDADPQSLRNLRSSISRGRTDIDRAIAGMRSALKNTHWNDDRRRQFEQDLEALLQSVSGFVQKTDGFETYLTRKADDLDRYLSS